MPESNVTPMHKPETPPEQIASKGRQALQKLVELLDNTANLPMTRTRYIEMALDVDQELVTGIVNARANGNLRLDDQPVPVPEPVNEEDHDS